MGPWDIRSLWPSLGLIPDLLITDLTSFLFPPRHPRNRQSPSLAAHTLGVNMYIRPLVAPWSVRPRIR